MAADDSSASLRGSSIAHHVIPTTNALSQRLKSHAAGHTTSNKTAFSSSSSSSSNIATITTTTTRSPPQNNERKLSKRRRARSFARRFKSFATKHTWTIPLVLLLAFGAAYALDPSETNLVHRFICLSYPIPNPDAATPNDANALPLHYGKGLWDLAFVAFYTIVLSFTREFIMQEIMRPLAKSQGIRSKGKQLRFMEQMYTAVYFGIMGPLGVLVMRGTPAWYFNTRGMYENFPHRSHTALFKFYYLFQAAYWAQQAIVMILGVEKRRRDFKELVAHHVVTVALVGLSYRFHFTYMGVGVYLTHDISDFFLALSKSFNYINSRLVEPFFAITILGWIYLRNYLNLLILYSILTEFRTVGPYELNWETQQYKCLLSNVITFSLLASLQALNLFWLYCLLRNLYKFVFLSVKKDDRSEEESEAEEVPEKKTPLLNGDVDQVKANGSS
ncbi:Sphingosine N-acyltransferase-like protein FUM17 [Cladobotryum mycophilum]|uniref:Sphingosine N-acyltransferase-like protein FUM17 n=1 Tax=Cladobotryum mycophilum TaxID=491253 RepID=A0ABR0SBZ8_9HYPO